MYSCAREARWRWRVTGTKLVVTIKSESTTDVCSTTVVRRAGGRLVGRCYCWERSLNSFPSYWLTDQLSDRPQQSSPRRLREVQQYRTFSVIIRTAIWNTVPRYRGSSRRFIVTLNILFSGVTELKIHVHACKLWSILYKVRKQKWMNKIIYIQRLKQESTMRHSLTYVNRTVKLGTYSVLLLLCAISRREQ